MPPFSAAILIGGAAALGGAAISSDAARKAAGTQAAAANSASQVQQNMFNTTQQNLQPWMQQGNIALNALNQLSGLQQVIPYQGGVPAQQPQFAQPGVQGITQDQALSQYGMTDPANAAAFARLDPASQSRLIELAKSGNKTLFDKAAQQMGLVQGTNINAIASMPIPIQQGQAQQQAAMAPQGVPGAPMAPGVPGQAAAPPGAPAQAPGVPLSQIGQPGAPQAAAAPQQSITAEQAKAAGLTEPKNIEAFGKLSPDQQAKLIAAARQGNPAQFSKLAASMGLNPGTRMNVVAKMGRMFPVTPAQPAVPANLAHVGTPGINPMSTQPLGSTDPTAGGTFNPNAPLVKPFTLADFQQSPAYQFNLQQGQQAIDKAANARGNLYAPQTLQDIGRFSQGLASNEFQNAFQNYNTNQQNIWNRLQTLSGSGQNAAANLGSLGAQAAGQIGQNQIGAGNAQAAGQVGQANAINQGLGGVYNAYLMQQILARNNQGIAGNYGSGIS